MSETHSIIPKDWLKQTTPADFDGHTGFESWTPEQRLAWLSEAAEFAYEARVQREALARSTKSMPAGNGRPDGG